MLFQLCVVTGILIAQLINIGTSHLEPYGWRISLGLAAVPGVVLLIGGLLLPETPNSLIERGYLQRVRPQLALLPPVLSNDVYTSASAKQQFTARNSK